MSDLLTMTNLMRVVDVAIVWFVLYKMIKFVQGTRAIQIMLGVAVIVLIKIASWYLGLTTISWFMDQVINWGPIALVVVFQQEIRKGLEELGRRTMIGREHLENASEQQLIQALDESLQYLSKRRIGALIAIERQKSLSELVQTGIKIDAEISGALLINTFIPNTPLHDGAVIIQNNRLMAATAYLPLSESTLIPKELGTRHRAGVGVSEDGDAIAVIVSEETGEISIATNGDLLRNMSQETYLNFFEKQFLPATTNATTKHWWQKGARR
ncbi:MAG TPA: diadenylate cyclase CdaA [Lactobacillaceae bacterium]|jgi:diadenylate cyclase